MYHYTIGLIKINTSNIRSPIWTVACSKFTCTITLSFLSTWSNEWTEDFFPFRDGFDWDGSRKKADFFFSYCTNKSSFHNYLWWTFKPSQILFGVGGFSAIWNSRYETTGLTWSNMERISSRYVLWYLLLFHRLILALDSPHGVWWRLISSSAPWAMIGSSTLIATIHTFNLACVGSLLTADEFGISSVA